VKIADVLRGLDLNLKTFYILFKLLKTKQNKNKIACPKREQARSIK